MFQVGEIIRCPADGEFGVIVDIQAEVEGMWIASGFSAYKIAWQGSPARSDLKDALVEWCQCNEDFVSVEEYERNQKD